MSAYRTAPARRRGVRLTRRVFWDLALCMVGLGLAVGLVFPPFAVLLGVPGDVAGRALFRGACLAAGFLVGALSYALCRWLVGGRLAQLSVHLRAVADAVAAAGRSGEWSRATTSRIAVDSDDELGATAAAFNSLLDGLEGAEHFRSLVRGSSDVIAVVDRTGRLSYVTPSVEQVLGHPPASLLGTRPVALLHPEDRGVFAVARDPRQPVLARARHRDGSWRWLETVTGDLTDDPAVVGTVLTTRDVSERLELEERLRQQAFHDPLTGLPNRALFMERLRAAEAVPASRGGGCAVLFLDLDNLKTVNDGLGHEAGDALLREVSDRVREAAGARGLAARLAGDEFAVLLTGPGAAEEARRTADRVLAALREPVRLADRWVPTGVSIGLATAQEAASCGLGLLRAADVAMYAAKSAGKGRCEVFRPRHHRDHLERERLTADLHLAVAEGQLLLEYQPVVELLTGRVRGFEALVRWRHPRRGLVPPADFVPLAEESGLIVPVGRWVLREACRQAGAWEREHGVPVGVSVNVSARQFQHPSLVRDVEEALAAADVPADRLTLEITESVLVADAERTSATMRRLRATGVRVALDDFGTGYSSLSYLRRFPIDVLKIDKSFIDDVVDDAEDRAVTAAIVQLGRTLDLLVVAEGVETAEQVAVLAGLGCPVGQGFRFARPLPPGSAVAHLLAAGAAVPA
ncbi:putative bifunctional diguanylate cyclase/phosphodiesterase [Kineococcus sp. SYSU DK004]|uniref:putative bifunctional diguanylate cyclase/phosphodiesterase n=1 Tax=Kineococcus sp. SYSU DK004 TaxID=3383125 RepID=UPI003D7F0004